MCKDPGVGTVTIIIARGILIVLTLSMAAKDLMLSVIRGLGRCCNGAWDADSHKRAF
jgi:hypothetical protein